MKRFRCLCLSVIFLSGCAVQRQYNSDWFTSRGNFQRTASVNDAPGAPLQQKWVFETKGRIAYAPSVYQGVAYFGSRDGKLYAVRLEDGAELWQEELEQGGIYQSPTISAESIFTGKWAPYYFVYAWQRETGEMLWSRQTGELINRSPWVLNDEERIYTHIDPPVDSGGLSSTGPRAMATAWSLLDQSNLWKTPLMGIPEQAPSLSDDLILFATNDDTLQALERETGHVRWSADLASKPISAPLVYADKVFVASESGFVYAFYLKEGKIAWRYQFVGTRLSGDMAIKDNVLYVPGGNVLYSFNLNHLEPGWKFRAPKEISAPVVSDENVYFGCANNMLYVMDRKKGYVTGLYRLGGEILAPPILAAGLVLVGASDGKLYAFEEKPAQEKKQASPPRNLNQRW